MVTLAYVHATEIGPSSPSATLAGLSGSALDLSYHRRTVVQDASITLNRSCVTALVGPNGSGKSTLLRCLARLHQPDSGDVHLPDGGSALGLTPKEFARQVSLLTQSRPTPNGISVSDVVGFGRHPYRGRWRAEDPDGPSAVSWAMEVTGIEAMAERGVDELSGGELQRVWLATCLAQRTGVLLLDEPTTFLDIRFQVEILDLIRDLADLHEVAVGVVLHDLDQAASVADQMALLSRGEIVATGRPPEVMSPSLLSETYGIMIEVLTDPVSGHLTTRPVGKHTHRLRVPA